MKDTPSRKIPVVVAALVNRVLVGSHASLDSLFREAGAPGEPPQLSHAAKWKTWLLRANDAPHVDPLDILGKVLEEFMEVEPPGTDSPVEILGLKFQSPYEEWRNKKSRIERALASHGLKYQTGGRIVHLFTSTPTESMRMALRHLELETVDIEFHRALRAVDDDPGSAITAGCALLEALFREYIAEMSLEEPSKLNLKSLWSVVQQNMGLNPRNQTDADIQRILSGITSVTDGIASMRTHGGSAHGGGQFRYSMRPRHARLLVNAAHTLAAFVLETWAEKSNQKKKANKAMGPTVATGKRTGPIRG
jgi:hypothetical protein